MVQFQELSLEYGADSRNPGGSAWRIQVLEEEMQQAGTVSLVPLLALLEKWRGSRC